MRRLLITLSLALGALLAPAHSAFAISIVSHVRIVEFRLQGPNGAADEYVDVMNTSTTATDPIAGFALRACAGSGAPITKAVVPAGKQLLPGEHYLFREENEATFTGDATFASFGFDDGGVQITDRNPDTVGGTPQVIDAAGGTSANAGCREGTGLTNVPTGNGPYAFVRKRDNAGIPVDTGDNHADFRLVSPTADSDAAAADSNCNGGANSASCRVVGEARPGTSVSGIRQVQDLTFARLDPNCGDGNFPNGQIATGSNPPTLVARRKITNSGSGHYDVLHLRVAVITTFGTNLIPGQADIRPINSFDSSSGACAPQNQRASLAARKGARVLRVTGGRRAAHRRRARASGESVFFTQGADLVGGGTSGGLNSVYNVHLTHPGAPGNHFQGDANGDNVLDPGESINVELHFAINASGPFRIVLDPEVRATP